MPIKSHSLDPSLTRSEDSKSIDAAEVTNEERSPLAVHRQEGSGDLSRSRCELRVAPVTATTADRGEQRRESENLGRRSN